MNTSLILAVAVLKGPFPLLVTPWTEKAELDMPVLVKEAEYVDACGVGGIIWPTAGEVGGLDAEGEYERGLAALAGRASDATKPFWSRLTAICPGRTSAEALARIAKVEAIAKRTGAKMAILARPPDDATNQTMIAAHYRALAQATTLPVIIQTYNGKSPQPDVPLIAELAKEHPEIFGWVKEESPGDKVNDRMEKLLAHPEIHGVFSGWGAKGFVYQGSRIGTCGCITQRPAYAGLLTRVWNRLATGKDASDPELAEAYAKYLYMLNLGDIFSKAGDDEMRGPHLYVLERLGIFRNRLTRTGKPGAWKVQNFEMSETMKAEVDARFNYALGDTRAAFGCLATLGCSRGSAPTANGSFQSAGGDPAGGDPAGGDPRAPRIIAPRTDAQPSKRWQPIGNRRARVVHWGIVHNHSQGKWDAVLKLTNDFEMVGWVDDSSSKAMRMQEPKPKYYSKYPRLTPLQVFDEVKPDLIVVECSNEELVQVSTEIARHGIPMHMDKPLGTDPVGFRKMSEICESQGVPLQIGYMFRSNEAINKMVELAKDGTLGEIYSVEADLDHNYGYPKYPTYASHYPGGTAYLLACHAIEWAMPIFNDEMPLRTYSIIKPAPGDPNWAKTHSLTIMEYPRANCVFRVCSKGTQPCRHIRIDGTLGSMELEPIEDFRTVKHTTGLNEGLAKVDKLEIKLFLRKVNDPAKKAGFREGINRIVFKAPNDRYAGQLHELARIIRGEIPNPPGLYEHDLKVHKVSLDACNL